MNIRRSKYKALLQLYIRQLTGAFLGVAFFVTAVRCGIHLVGKLPFFRINFPDGPETKAIEGLYLLYGIVMREVATICKKNLKP